MNPSMTTTKKLCIIYYWKLLLTFYDTVVHNLFQSCDNNNLKGKQFKVLMFNDMNTNDLSTMANEWIMNYELIMSDFCKKNNNHNNINNTSNY